MNGSWWPSADGLLARWGDLVERWGLEAEERVALLCEKKIPVEERLSATSLLVSANRMRLIADLAPVLSSRIGDDDRIRLWLRTPRPDLDGLTPIKAMSRSADWTMLLFDNEDLAS